MPGADFAVSTAFKAIDKTSKVLKTIARNAKVTTTQMAGRFRSMGASAVRSFKTASVKISGVLNKLERKTALLGGKFAAAFKTGIAVAAIAALTLAVTQGVQVGLEFEQTIVNASAKFGPAAQRGTQAFKDIEAAAKNVGATTEFTASQAAAGFEFLALASFDAQQSIAALPLVVDLATAAQVDLARATDIATDTLGAMGLATKDPIQLTRNLSRVNDVLAKTTTTSNTNMEQLFETLVKAGPPAIKLGSSIEQLAAFAGKLANAGLKGSDAGTVLKNVFIRLSAVTPLASKTLGKLGVTTRTAEGDLRDMSDILGDLNQATKTLGSAERAQALNNIFGRIPIAGVNVLLAEGAQSLRDYQTELESASGASKEMAAVMRATTLAAVKTLKSAFEGLQLTIFDQIQPAFLEVVKGLTFIVGGWSQFLKQHPAIISLLVTIAKIAAPVIAITVAVIGLNVAIAAMNFLLAANPIGLVVIGIVAAIAAIVVFRKQILAVGAVILGAMLTPLMLVLKLISLIPGLGFVGKGVDIVAGTLTGIAKEGFGMGAGDNAEGKPLKTPGIATAKQISETRKTTTNRVILEDGTGRARMAEDDGSGAVELIPRTADFSFDGAGA